MSSDKYRVIKPGIRVRQDSTNTPPTTTETSGDDVSDVSILNDYKIREIVHYCTRWES